MSESTPSGNVTYLPGGLENLRTLAEQATAPKMTPGMPTDSAERKRTPVATGVLAYFPDAIAEVAKVSQIGNDKHNPGEPLHWARGKSMDQTDCIVRHLMDYFLAGGPGDVRRDFDGSAFLAQVAWRAMAQLQLDCEAAKKK